MALTLVSIAALMLLFGFIEWLQTGRWESISVLRAGYDLHVLRASWFLRVDWGWRVHEMLDHVPLLAFLLTAAPVAWAAGTYFARR